jgi:hypothetical protein
MIMNRVKRAELTRAANLISEALGIIESVSADEEGAYENLPEGIQGSDRGETIYEAVEILNTSAESLEEVQGEIEAL